MDFMMKHRSALFEVLEVSTGRRVSLRLLGAVSREVAASLVRHVGRYIFALTKSRQVFQRQLQSKGFSRSCESRIGGTPMRNAISI